MTDPRLIRLIRALEDELGCSPELEVARRILAAIDGVTVASHQTKSCHPPMGESKPE